MKTTAPLRLALLVAALSPTPSFAEEPLTAKGDWTFSLGVATLYMPAFTGSKDYQVLALPDLKIEYKDRLFISLFEGIGYNIINTESWRAGPIAKFDFGREENSDEPFRIAGKKTKALRGLGDVDPTVELGGFLEYKLDPLSLKVELRQGVGGHEGLIGEAGINYSHATEALGPLISFEIGPHATFANSSYNQTFFGINQTQSAKSGLVMYKAKSGLVSYGVGGRAMIQASKRIAISVIGEYDRLGDQAAKSPLVKQRGSTDQFMAGIGVSYQFGY